MSISINEFKVNCLTMYNNRAVDEKFFSEVQQLTVTQRVKAFALEIFAILALVFSVDKENWSRVVKELHAQVWTGVAYIPLTPSRAAQSDAQKTSLPPKNSQQATDEKNRKITKDASSSSSSSSVSSSSSTEFTTSTSSTHPSLSRQAMRKIRQEASDIFNQINELCGRGFGFRDDTEQLMSLSSQTHQEILIRLLRLVTLLSFEIEYKKGLTGLTDLPESFGDFHINLYLAYFERFKLLTWIVDKDEFLNRELVEPRLQRRIDFIIKNPYQSQGSVVSRRISLPEDKQQISLSAPVTSSSAPSTAISPVGRPSDEQIRRFAAELNSVDRQGAFGITEETVKQFLDRGGHIQLLEEGQQIPLKRGERYIVGCSSGVNRSQTHAAYMIRNGVSVDAILAGGDSAFNPTASIPMLSTLYFNEADEAAFKAQFGFGKRPQFGSEFNNGIQLDQENFCMVPGVREHYEGLVNGLEPTHFIAYALSGPSVLKRLLDSNKQSLAGFTITFVNWVDQIMHAPEGVAPCSQEAYRRFEERVAAHFPIVD